MLPTLRNKENPDDVLPDSIVNQPKQSGFSKRCAFSNLSNRRGVYQNVQTSHIKSNQNAQVSGRTALKILNTKNSPFTTRVQTVEKKNRLDKTTILKPKNHRSRAESHKLPASYSKSTFFTVKKGNEQLSVSFGEPDKCVLGHSSAFESEEDNDFDEDINVDVVEQPSTKPFQFFSKMHALNAFERLSLEDDFHIPAVPPCSPVSGIEEVQQKHELTQDEFEDICPLNERVSYLLNNMNVLPVPPVTRTEDAIPSLSIKDIEKLISEETLDEIPDVRVLSESLETPVEPSFEN